MQGPLYYFTIVGIDKWGLGQRPSCLNLKKNVQRDMSPLKDLKLLITRKNTTMRAQSDKRFKGLVLLTIVGNDEWGLGQGVDGLNY